MQTQLALASELKDDIYQLVWKTTGSMDCNLRALDATLEDSAAVTFSKASIGDVEYVPHLVLSVEVIEDVPVFGEIC